MQIAQRTGTLTCMTKNLVRLSVVLALAGALIFIPFVRAAEHQPVEEEPSSPYGYLTKDPYTWTKEEAQMYTRKIFGDKADVAIAIFLSESEYKFCAEGDIGVPGAELGSWGIPQINKAKHLDKIQGRDLCNPKHAIDIAFLVYKERKSFDSNGFNAWTDFVNGKFNSHLPQARLSGLPE